MNVMIWSFTQEKLHPDNKHRFPFLCICGSLMGMFRHSCSLFNILNGISVAFKIITSTLESSDLRILWLNPVWIMESQWPFPGEGSVVISGKPFSSLWGLWSVLPEWVILSRSSWPCSLPLSTQRLSRWSFHQALWTHVILLFGL